MLVGLPTMVTVGASGGTAPSRFRSLGSFLEPFSPRLISGKSAGQRKRMQAVMHECFYISNVVTVLSVYLFVMYLFIQLFAYLLIYSYIDLFIY